MDIVMIPTKDIAPNEYNPNVVPEAIMKQLKTSIKENGIEQPVLVRKTENFDVTKLYIIIDGEHRWRTAQDLGLKEIPCTVKDISEHEAMIQTINMNKLRGEFDQLKLADVLKSLKDVYSPEELEAKLGYTLVELKGFEDLVDFDFDKLEDNSEAINAITESQKNDESAMLNEFSINCSLKQLEIIEAAISEMQADPVDKAWSLEMICTDYLNAHAPEKIGEIENRLKKLAAQTLIEDAIEKEEEKEEVKEEKEDTKK